VKYLLFDVFAEQPFEGNQLAVFPEGDGVADEVMQRAANELNIAESIFLTRTGDPNVPARVRIFTPGREIPFAGHPTVGASVAIADVLGWIPHEQTSFALEERVGEVAICIDRSAETIAWLRTPAVTFGATFDRAACAEALTLSVDRLHPTLPVQVAGAGSPLPFIPLRDMEAVDASVFDHRAALQLTQDVVGVFLFAQTSEGTYARMFAPMSGIPEDPATGGATGPLYAYLFAHGAIAKQSATYRGLQGVKMGRRSVLHVHVHASNGRFENVDVGGRAIHVGQGELLH
jgi:trans-2,3-dihydro-3-hydroxyanthranilate isomerase